MATLASLVVNIGADIADLKRGVDEGNAKIESFATKASKAFNALTGAAAFGVIAGGIRQMVAAADEIDTLSARIGDSAEAVQKLQAVAEVFDVEMTAVVKGVQELQTRLGSGKIDAALQALNIRVDEFKTLSPADQFLTAADALSKIENPLERAARATDLFGANAKALNGALREGVKDTDAWIAMSDRTVGNLDRIGTWFSRASSAVVAFSANVLTNITLMDQYQRVVDLFSKETPKLPAAPPTGGGFAPGMPSKAMLDEVTASTNALVKQAEEYRKEHEKTAEAIRVENERFRESVTLMATAAGGWRAWGQYAKGAIDTATQEAFEFEQQMRSILTAIDLSARAWEPFKQGVQDSRDEVEVLAQRMQALQNWRNVGQSLAGALMGALQGGGDVGRSLGGEAGRMLGTQLGTSIGNWAGRAIGGGLGAAIGGAAGSILPVVGTMLGAGAGSLIGRLFGGGEGRQVNDMRDQFVAAAGGIHELNVRAQEAGLTLDRLLRARNVQDFNAAVNELTGAFSEQEQLHQRGIAAMERYGITIEEAGAKFKQTQMNATAEDLLKDFHALVNIGVDTDIIIEKMGGSLQEFVNRSISMGTTVPKEMQGIIAKMIENKQLVDENGEAFTDLSQIPFAESMNEGMSRLIDKIETLIDRIGGDLPRVIKDVPRSVDIDFNGRWNFPGGEGEFPALAEGGIVRKPTLALIGEAGPEAVVPLTRMGQLQASNSGGGEVHIHMHNPILSGYSSAVTAARELLGVLSQEQERRGRSLAFGAA